MIKAEGITHFSLPVRDLDEAEAFYRDMVGLELRGRLGNSGMSRVGVGAFDILLCKTDDLPVTDVNDPGSSQVHQSFHMPAGEWEKGVRQLAEKGVPITHLEYREKGHFTGREVYFVDPSGNRLELRDPTWQAGMPKLTIDEIVAAAATTA